MDFRLINFRGRRGCSGAGTATGLPVVLPRRYGLCLQHGPLRASCCEARARRAARFAGA